MEFSKFEMKAVEVAIEEVTVAETRELQALELALVGGGIGDVVFG